MQTQNKLPDRAYEAAVAVLGSVMLDPESSGDVFAAVRPDDFIAPEYRTIYEAERRLFLAGQPVDPVSVTAALGDDYRPLILQIMDLTPTAANCMSWVEILKAETQLHRLRTLGAQLAQAGALQDASQILEQARQLTASSTGMQALSLADGYLDFCERQNQKPEYVSFGIETLDKLTYAELGDYVLLGARPSTGKTALALQLAASMSKRCRVGFFSLETRDAKLIDRTLAHLYGLSYTRIKKHSMTREDWMTISTQMQRMTESQLEIVQATGRTAEEIASYARYRRYQIVIVDYVQLVRTAQKNYSREQEVAQISSTLANFARDHGVMVIALAQLTRDKEDDRRKTVRAPTLASFRESGSLEQDADIAMLMYLSEPDNRASDRILRLAKNKEGVVGKMTMAFDGDKQTFFERVQPPDNPYARRGRLPHMTPVLSGSPGQVSLEDQGWRDVTDDTHITRPEDF